MTGVPVSIIIICLRLKYVNENKKFYEGLKFRSFLSHVICKGESLTESEVSKMALKHRITINVSEPDGSLAVILKRQMYVCQGLWQITEKQLYQFLLEFDMIYGKMIRI